MITQIANSLYDQFITDFEVRSPLWAATETEALHRLRQRAFDQFKKSGIPSTKVEDWKYTNLTPFLKESFTIAREEESGRAINEEILAKAGIEALDAYKIVVVNGQFQPDLSDPIPGTGVLLEPLTAAMHRPAFQKHFGAYIDVQKNPFAALNTALFHDGIFIEIQNKTVPDKPIHLVHVYIASDNVFLQPRNLFVVGAQAEATIIESFLTIGKEANIFVNTASELVLGENARLQHYTIQTGEEKSRYIQLTQVYQQASSVYNNYKASLPGAGLLRNNHNVVLDGENIESHLYGIYLAAGRQLVDNHTEVDHRQPHCQSNELYKGVMKDEATGVFNGKIFVRKPAQKTNAFQQNNNLMLSRKAVVDSKPQLEIFADDVKCSHGSTVGQFNNDALFYLRSRGIGEESAKALLIHAFAFDVTDKIPIPEVQAHINQLIEEGLGD